MSRTASAQKSIAATAGDTAAAMQQEMLRL
jgi:hypothetical protein